MPIKRTERKNEKDCDQILKTHEVNGGKNASLLTNLKIVIS